MAATALSFTPINVGRWVIWSFTALVFVCAPRVFDSLFATTLLSQVGITIVFALSYNMLLGQSGMLSFGHAVYSGLGAFFAIHVLVWIGASRLIFPVSLLPLVGGVAGMIFGIVFGWLTTQKAGTPFAMISLGIGEMVFAASLMFPGFFGGEAGVRGDRTVGGNFLGIPGWNFGTDIQVYYLVAAWTFLCMVAMFALTHTPLGRIANAVRDNPERAEFIGYNTQRVRWLMLILSSFFAGISGGLSAINFEIVSSENVHALKSGGVLLATFIGGVTFFFGPILGSIVFVLFAVALSELTRAWQLYLGVFFVVMVMYAPGGLASLVLLNLRLVKFKRFACMRDAYFGVIVTGVAALTGVAMLIELMYHVTLDLALGPDIEFMGFTFDSTRLQSWVMAAALALGGGAGFEYARRGFKVTWDQIAGEIENWTRDNPDKDAP